jgi:hypothetical protein
MSNSTKTPTAAATSDPAAISDATLIEIGRLAVDAHRATVRFAHGRNGGASYRGADGMRDLERRKGEAALALREAIRVAIGD